MVPTALAHPLWRLKLTQAWRSPWLVRTWGQAYPHSILSAGSVALWVAEPPQIWPRAVSHHWLQLLLDCSGMDLHRHLLSPGAHVRSFVPQGNSRGRIPKGSCFPNGTSSVLFLVERHQHQHFLRCFLSRHKVDVYLWFCFASSWDTSSDTQSKTSGLISMSHIKNRSSWRLNYAPKVA